MKEINLEEIIQQCIGIRPGAKNTTPMDYYECKFVMKELAKQLLELAAENAMGEALPMTETGVLRYGKVDKQSILDTINQIK
jgi:hypothetical protein